MSTTGSLAGEVVVTGAGRGQAAAETRLLTAEGAVDEVAALVAFPLGNGSSSTTGAEIPVRGRTAHGGVTSTSDAVATATT